MDGYYNVFVCHVWKYHDPYYEGLVKLLRREFFIRDLSVPEYRSIAGSEEKVWRQIRMAIRDSDVVLVIDTPAITHSTYACRELDFAKRSNKPIIALVPHGNTERVRRSAIVRNYCKTECSWSGTSISRAIEFAAS